MGGDLNPRSASIFAAGLLAQLATLHGHRLDFELALEVMAATDAAMPEAALAAEIDTLLALVDELAGIGKVITALHGRHAALVERAMTAAAASTTPHGG